MPGSVEHLSPTRASCDLTTPMPMATHLASRSQVPTSGDATTDPAIVPSRSVPTPATLTRLGSAASSPAPDRAA